MRVSVAILLLIFSFNTVAQITIHQELKFVEHLVNQGEYDDAIFYIEGLYENNYPFTISDSLNFYGGWSHYSLMELEQSTKLFLNVSKNSALFYKSRFFAAYNKSHLAIVPTSNHILESLETDGLLKGLKKFELSGNALLMRDYGKFEKLMIELKPYQEFAFSKEKEKFFQFADELKSRKEKHPFVAGLMSAIIPGSGKIYAGKTGEGIASFIIVTASGFTAAENYNKLGIKHAKTLLFGSLFAVLYIGNIYGSVFTVKLVNEKFNHEMDHKILFNMHIPLRNIFN